jgi:hypothetical protein
LDEHIGVDAAHHNGKARGVFQLLDCVDPSIALQQVIRSVPKTKLSGSQRLAMDTFYEATKGNVASARLALDEWRPLFNERHTGDNQSSKNTAFARARKDLVDKGLLKCRDDIYRLGDKAT